MSARPSTHSRINTSVAYRSERTVAGRPWRTSGAMWGRVPVTQLEGCGLVPGGRAIPKSVSQALPSEATSTFPGATSR
jgi:hypothetical protein